MKVEYHYFICQKCGFIEGNAGFSHISQTQFDYDVDFSCPKCQSIDIKQRTGITEVEPPSPKIEELIRKCSEESRLLKAQHNYNWRLEKCFGFRDSIDINCESCPPILLKCCVITTKKTLRGDK